MELKSFFVQDAQGNIVPSPTVYVYLPGTTTLVDGLKNAAGADLVNPFIGASNGQVQFAAPDGNYDMRTVAPGRDFTQRVRFIDATGVQAALDAKVDGRATITASEAIGARAFVNIYSSGGNTRVRNANAADPAKFANGFAPAAIASGAAGAVVGFGLNAGVAVATPASEVWLSDTTPGAFATSPPSTEGCIVQSLGPAIPGVGVLFFPQPRIIL